MNDMDEVADPVQAVLSAARDREPPSMGPLDVETRRLDAALSRAEFHGRVPIIGEVKPSSPTSDTVKDIEPAEVAAAFVTGGAAAISVLTEPTEFGGSPRALDSVRNTVDVPVLRKDFLLEPAELDRVAADAVLVIARFIDDLSGMIDAARQRGMQPLVEVHTEEELQRASAAGAKYIGINNRDLADLSVDLSTFERVAPAAPARMTLIAESGISRANDVRRMREAGADGLLIGTALMDGDPAKNLKGLVYV